MALVELRIPPGWFDNDMSARVCRMLGIREIKAKEWTTLARLYSFPLGGKFELVPYILANKLHAIIFDDNEQTIRFHPDLILKIAGKELKRMRREDGVH